MKKSSKFICVCFIGLGLTACGSSKESHIYETNAKPTQVIITQPDKVKPTDVKSRTGSAKYNGTFKAKVTPNAGIQVGNQRYNGGDFTGKVTAKANFDKDVIDLSLEGNKKAGVIDSYKAEFDDAKIKGGKFTGIGTESVSAGGIITNAGRGAKLDGAFTGKKGEKISGKASSTSGLVKVEADFSASETK